MSILLQPAEHAQHAPSQPSVCVVLVFSKQPLRLVV